MKVWKPQVRSTATPAGGAPPTSLLLPGRTPFLGACVPYPHRIHPPAKELKSWGLPGSLLGLHMVFEGTPNTVHSEPLSCSPVPLQQAAPFQWTANSSFLLFRPKLVQPWPFARSSTANPRANAVDSYFRTYPELSWSHWTSSTSCLITADSLWTAFLASLCSPRGQATAPIPRFNMAPTKHQVPRNAWPRSAFFSLALTTPFLQLTYCLLTAVLLEHKLLLEGSVFCSLMCPRHLKQCSACPWYPVVSEWLSRPSYFQHRQQT